MGVPGPFIVVAPLSTITNWVKEFRNFAPEMPVILYHGNQVYNSLSNILKNVIDLTVLDISENLKYS